MLDDLESIGNVKEVDKTVIKQHLFNYSSDIKAMHEEKIEKLKILWKQEGGGEVNGNKF